MKTAKFTKKNPSSGVTTFATVLLNTGAKYTYIRTHKARSIGIEGKFREMVKLNTFGTDKQSTMQAREISFMIHQSNGSYKKIRCKDT